MAAKPNIRRVLLAQADVYKNVDASAEAELLIRLADTVCPKNVLLPGLDILPPLEPVLGESDSEYSGADVLGLISDLSNVSKAVSAKKNVDADLGRLTKFLTEHSEMSLADLLSAVLPPKKLEKKKIFSSKLKESLGRPEFALVLEKMFADKDLTRDDLLDIAKASGNPVGGKPTKAKLKEHFLRAQQNLETFEAKERAMGGRSAA